MDAVAYAAARLPKPAPRFIGAVGHSYTQPWASGISNDADGWFESFCRMLGARQWDNRAIPGAVACWAVATGSGDGGWAHALNAMRQNNALFSIPPYLGPSSGKANNYAPRSTIEVIYYGINDLARLGSNNLRPYLEAMRAIMSFACGAKILVGAQTSPYGVESGTWAASGGTAGAQNYTGQDRTSTVQGSAYTYTQPSDVPSGRVVSQLLVVRPSDDYVVTVARNGTTVSTTHIQGSVYCDPNHTGVTNPGNVTVLRTSGVNPGDTVSYTLTTLTAGGMQRCALVIESDPTEGPLLFVPQPSTPTDYSTYASFPFGPSAGTNPINDAAVASLKTQLLAGPIAEFGSRVITVDPDTVITKALLPTGDYSSDGLHWHGGGHAKMARLAVQAVAPRLTPKMAAAAVMSTPSRYWLPLNVFHIGGAGWPSGLSFGNTWTSFDSNSYVNGYSTYPGFRRDEASRVHIRGRVKPGVSSTTGTTIVTLPSGFRPANTRYFPVAGQDASNNVLAGIATVLPTGALSIAWSTGTPAWWALDSISFVAEGP